MQQSTLNNYITAQRQAGHLSPTTLRQYTWHLEHLAQWLAKQNLQLDQIDRNTLRQWGASLYDHWQPATIKQAICAARHMFAWLHHEGIIDEDPAQGLRVPKVRPRPQRTLTQSDVTALLDCCDDSTKGKRDRAILNLLIDTGLRAAEICRLQLADLDIEAQSLTVQVKGGWAQRRFYGETTAATLQAWIDVRQTSDPALFVSLGGTTPGQALTTRGLRVIVKRIGEKAGVQSVSPHAFRRGFATIAIAAGAPTRTVQLAGGWSDLRMVERYTQALERNQLHDRWSPADLANTPKNKTDP